MTSAYASRAGHSNGSGGSDYEMGPELVLDLKGRGPTRARRQAARNGAIAVDGYRREVPEISRFYGVRISMFYDEHAPAHFHARYGEHSASIEIETLAVVAGGLPNRVLGLVVEWASAHRTELRADWERARRAEPLLPIEPLG